MYLCGGINLCFLFLQVEGFALQSLFPEERLRPTPWAGFPPLACKMPASSVKLREGSGEPAQGSVGTMKVEGEQEMAFPDTHRRASHHEAKYRAIKKEPSR